MFLWGKKGSGKTLRAVEESFLDWLCGYEIWGNLWLHPYFDTNYKTRAKGNYHYVDAVDLINMLLDDKIPTDNTPKLLILDEMKSQANARSFMSTINKHLATFISQARKRSFKVIYTGQIISEYDKWIRMMTDYITACRPIIDPKNIGWGSTDYPEPLFFQYIQATIDEQEPNGIGEVFTYYRSRKVARLFYPCYKTRQMIAPVDLKYQNQESYEVRELEQQIKEVNSQIAQKKAEIEA